jgi:predicted acetyltransferase
MEPRTLRADELEQAFALDADAFHVPAERREWFLRHADPARLHGLFDGGRLVALTGVLPFGQFFGGRAVPMGGLASVAVAPDRRGRGLARRVIAAALASMRERGEVISTLYPAMTRLYRGMGWEAAGAAVWRKLAPRSLEALPAPSSGRVRPAGAGDEASIRACYARVAAGVNGHLDRPERWWRRQQERWPQRSLYVRESAAGALDGYLAYRQLDGPWTGLGGPFGLVVDELVAEGRDAALALWRLLGSWASQVEQILYRGASEDALLLLLPEQELPALAEVRWMTRVVDPAGAVAARGFPPGLDVEVHLSLSDPQLASSSGDWVLRVEAGRGRLERGGRGALALDVGAFSSLYTGWASAAMLARAGRLAGGSTDERARLDACFAGPTPWMLDEF